VSVTIPPAVANKGVHGGEVVAVTRISPSLSCPGSSKLMMTRAIPRIFPGDPGAPPNRSGCSSDGSRGGLSKNLPMAAPTGLFGGGP
jgi:hypothetical protein